MQIKADVDVTGRNNISKGKKLKIQCKDRVVSDFPSLTMAYD
jgi:hypothetical protein